jgi:hypothetical protein
MGQEKWNEEDLIYAAGFLDGEGCFSIGRHHKITVSASNTDKAVIEWLKKTFGGSVCMNATHLRKPNHRQVYSWSVVSNDADRLCKSIVPYLRVKTAQCVGLILMKQTTTAGGKRLEPELLQERDRIALRVKELKRV